VLLPWARAPTEAHRDRKQPASHGEPKFKLGCFEVIAPLGVKVPLAA
jgi:hypothetical protein